MASKIKLPKFDSVTFGKGLAVFIVLFFAALLIEGIVFQSGDEGQCGHPIGKAVANDLKAEIALGIGDSLCIEPDAPKEHPQTATAQAVTKAPVSEKSAPDVIKQPSTSASPSKDPAPTGKAESVVTTDSQQRELDRKRECSMPGEQMSVDSNVLPASCTNWVLNINGRDIAKGEKIQLDRNVSGGSKDTRAVTYFRFALPRTVDTADSESAIIRSIWSGAMSGWSPVNEASIRLCATDEPPKGMAKKCIALSGAKLRIYHGYMLATGAVLLLLFGAGLVWMCRNTGIIRDPASGTYSLARTQVMYWFALVTAGFVFIYMSTGQYIGVITAETLGLLGIYSATGWLAASRSESPVDANTGKVESADHTEGSFLAELLTDSTTDDKTGFGLHRLITIIWSIILGAIMVQWVVGQKMFADFDSSQLALAGLTSGLFALMKPDVNKPAK